MMKHLLKRIIAWALLLALLMGVAPQITPKASAGGIDPEVLGYVSAGQALRIDIHGDNMYSTTNLVFKSNGNTIATIVGYDESDKEVLNLNICTDNLLEFFYNATNGYYFECKVLYGELRILYNSANSSQNPTLTYSNHADKLDWVVKGNMQEIYLTVGDTASLDVGEVADGYSAKAESYAHDNYTIATINRDGTIRAVAPGTTEVFMTCVVWISNTQFFRETLTCVVHVVEDYSLAASFAHYYNEPSEKFFNIVAYNRDGQRETGFNITVGENTYSTEGSYWKLLEIPDSFSGSVIISKDGYMPYTLSADHLQLNNVILLCPQDGTTPAVQAVWVRPKGTQEYTNVKLQPIQVLQDANVEYTISFDAFWNGHGCSTVFLQQGNITVPLSASNNTLVLGSLFSSDGGPIYLHALTVDGYTITVPLMISIGTQITQMEMDFGEFVSAKIEEQITSVGGNEVAFDLNNTITVKYVVNHDGTIRGIIGVKLAGKSEEQDLLALYDEIRETATKIKAADAIGDTVESSRLSKKLQSSINKRNAQLDRKYSTFGFEGSIGFMGYFDATLLSGDVPLIREVGIIANVQVSAVGGKVDYTTVVPTRWKVKFTESLELLFSNLVDEQSGQLKLGVPAFSNSISVSGEVSAGAFGTAEAAGTVTGSVNLSYPNGYGNFSDGVWTLNLNFHSGVKLFGKEALELFDWDPIKDYQIYPKKSAAASPDISPLSLGDAAVFADTAADQPTGGIAQTQTILTNTYPDSQPQLARLENMDVLVWIDANGQSTDANRTCLYFAVRDHQTATWSDPAPVGDDGFADFYPQLFTAGDTLYVLWQKANTQLADSSTLEEILLSMNVYISAFDPAQGCFGTPECIHKDNALLDFMPQLQLVDGTLCAVWLCSSETIFAPEAACSLKKAVYTADMGWAQQTLCSIPGTPDGMAFGSDGSVCYSLNGVLYRVADGVTSALTDDTVTATAPMYCQDTLYYLADGTLTDGTVTIPLGDTVSNYRIFTREDGSPMAVVYYDFNDAGRQLFAVFGSGDAWSEPVALTDEYSASFSGLSGFCDDDDQLLLASNWIVPDATTGQESAQLRLITIPQVCDLTLNDTDYLGTTLTQDGNLIVDLFLTNSGTTSIRGLQISALDGETQLNSKAVSLTLLPGESTSIELSLPMAQILSDNLTFTAQPPSGTDVHQEDNTLILPLVRGDISVENMTAQMLPDGSVHASAMLINRGMKDLEGIRVVLTRNTSDGDILTTMEMDSAAVGEVILVNCDLTGLAEGDLLYMTAVMDGTENYISNNTAFTQIGQPLTDSSTVTLSPDFQDANLELDTEYRTTLSFDSPATAFFTPETSGQYRICLEAYKGIAESWTPSIDADIYKEGDDFPCELLDFVEYGSSGSITHFSSDQCVYLEDGVTYSIQLSGNTGVLVKVTLKKTPPVTALHIDDITLTEGDHLSFPTSVAENLNLTFTPSDSSDILIYTSSAPGVAEVNEDGLVIANSPGTAVITAACWLSGAQTTFTVTVLPREPDGVVTEGQGRYIIEGGYYAFTPSQTGYYHITFDDFFSIQIPGKDTSWVYCADGSKAFLMEQGRSYTIRVSNSGDLLVKGLTPEEITLDNSYSCDCYDCSGTMLYRYVPEKDMAVSLYYRSQNACTLVICDENYQVITRLDTDSYTSDYLQTVLKAGKTYYIALEHDYSSRLDLSEITGFLYTESGNDTVFVGDTEKFAMWFSTDVEDMDTTLSLTSSDPSVAKVNADGTVTFLKQGTVTITGSALEGALVSSVTLNVQPFHELTLNEPKNLTLDGINTSAAMVSFTPDKSADYVLTIHYQTGGSYWEYGFDLTERSGSEIEWLNNENIPNGSTMTLKLEAGKTYDLRLYYYSYDMEQLFDLTFLVTFADCDANGHTVINDPSFDPGCDYPGLTSGSHCSVCGQVFQAQVEIPPLGHNYRNGSCTRCGETDPDYDEPTPGTANVIRLSGKDRYQTAFSVANQLKENLGVSRFNAVVVAYGQNFPDALTGSYLAAVKDAPILLTEPSVDASVLEYIEANLVPGGKVYILGGSAAVSENFEDIAKVMGFDVQRLKGAGRYETNLAILKEAGVNATDEVLIATGTNYADSLSASATGLPMLLVGNTLTDAQKEFLATTSKDFVILGGTGAVSAEVEAELAAIGTVVRVKGTNRYGTSVAIAERYFSNPKAAVLAYAQGFPDGLCGGPLAISMGAPLILTSNENPTAADSYVENITIGAVTGGTGRISDETVRAIFDLAADVEIPKK